MIIPITENEHKLLDENEQLIVNNEEFIFITEDDVETNDDCKMFYYIYQRPSDKKFFRVSKCWSHYGYEDYGYDSICQDLNIYEVELKEVIKKCWVMKED